jgi:head-tail adaptor
MSIIDPRMLAHLANFYPSTVTIQEYSQRRGTAGELKKEWDDKAGHVNLPARIGPSGGREIKLPDQTYAISTHTIALRGNYPTVTVKDRVLDDNDVQYDIMLVESDDQDASTYLYTRIVE